jgi:hypothetical protein
MQQSVLEKLMISWSRNSQPFTKTEGSLSFSQESATGIHPEPDESSPHFISYLIKTRTCVKINNLRFPNDPVSVHRTTRRRMVRWLMNNELQRIWKEVLVACSRYYPNIRLEELKNTTENLSQATRCPDGDENEAPLEYKLETYRYTNLCR